MKKWMSALLCLALAAAALGGCSPQEEVSSVAPSAPPEEAKIFQIGLVQYKEYTGLDALREAFMSRLEEWGCDESQVEIEYQNAGGDPDKAQEICEDFVAQDVDLIVALSPAAAQAAVTAAQGEKVQVLAAGVSTLPEGSGVTGVTTPSQAAGLVELAVQADSELDVLGLLYDPSNPDSKAAAQEAKDACAQQGLEVVESTVAGEDQVEQAMTDLCAQADAIYTPWDVTVAPKAAQAAEIAKTNGDAWYVGSQDMVQAGALAGMGPTARQVGAKAADLAVQLIQGREIDEVKPVALEDCQTFVNQTTLQALDLLLPQDVLSTAYISQ